MDLGFNLAPSNRDLKDPTTRQNFDDTVEQKRVIDLRACLILTTIRMKVAMMILELMIIHEDRGDGDFTITEHDEKA